MAHEDGLGRPKDDARHGNPIDAPAACRPRFLVECARGTRDAEALLWEPLCARPLLMSRQDRPFRDQRAALGLLLRRVYRRGRR